MQTETFFNSDGDRYEIDFTVCTVAKGWAQLDTAQDAAWFGNWVNPTARKIVSYAEGDFTIISCDTDEEFTAEVRRIVAWYTLQDGKPAAIDAMCAPALIEAFARLGLSDLQH